MPPRKPRLSPEERALRIAARMSQGTVAGRIESASPARRVPDPRISQAPRSGCPCPINVRHCLGGGGYTDEFGFRYSFSNFADYDNWVLSQPGLQAYYRLDETSGDFTDASGHGHTGVASGSGITYNQTGPLSGMKAITFDGAAGTFRANQVEVNVTKWIYVFWMKTTSTQTRRTILHARDSLLDANDGNMGVFYSEGGAFGSPTTGSLCYMDNGANIAGGRYTSPAYNDGSWHFVTAYWEGGDVGSANPGDYAHYHIIVDGTEPTMFEVNEGVNTSCHESPHTGTALNVATYPGKGDYWAGSIAGLAMFSQPPTETSTCELLKTDDVLIIDNGGLVSMPPAAEMQNHIYYVKSDAGTVTLDPDGSETIDNAATLTLGPLESAALVSDGTEWWVL